MKLGTIIYYKDGDNLQRCLESIGTQDHPDIAWVIIDNASEDGPEFKIKELVRHDYPSSFTELFLAGCSQLWKDVDAIGMLSADAVYLPNKISKSAKLFENQQVGIVYSDYVQKIGSYSTIRYDAPFSREVFGRSKAWNPEAFILKKALEEVGMPNPEDADPFYNLWMRITTKYVAMHIPEVLHYS